MKILNKSLVPAVLLGILSLAGPAVAAERPFRITAKGGMAIAKLRNLDDPYNVFQSLMSFTAGVGAEWGLGGSSAIQSEVLYVVKGVSYGESEGADEAGNPTGTFESLHVVEAVEIPVLLRWRIPVDWSVHPVLLGGPFVSFELSERFKTTGSQESAQDADVLKNTDCGVVLGGGLEFDLGPRQLVVEGRYDLGLVNIGPFRGSDPVQSGAFLLVTGIRF